MALTNKQRKFVSEYLIDMNATEAAKRAGYSVKTAKQQGSRLLTNVDVQNEVQRRQKISNANAQKTRENIIQDLQTVINMYLVSGRNTTNALKAIDMLSKMQGWYEPDKQEIVHKGLSINYVKPDKDK